MNYAPAVLAYLSQTDEFAEVLLVPGKQPVERTPNGLRPIGDNPMSALDVRDTLSTLMSHAPGGTTNLNKQGILSFGMPDRGRFRISYFTQRGSLVVSILHIPLKVPHLAALLGDEAAALAAEKAFLTFRSGLLVVTSPVPALANALVYALLNTINEADARVLFILEPYTSFLLRHKRSVVIQCEVGADVENVEHGIRTAFALSPDVLYVRDVANPADLRLVFKAAEAQVFTVLTASLMDSETLFPNNRVAIDRALLRGFWNVDRTDKGRLRLLME
jgi:twitching motility protein PilT